MSWIATFEQYKVLYFWTLCYLGSHGKTENALLAQETSYDTNWNLNKVLKIMWITCNFKKFDVNCCETVNVRPNLSENEIRIYYNVVGNRKAFLLSNLQRYTEVHKTRTQICICGNVLMVAVLVSLTDGGNLSHFNLKSHNYSVPLRWILPTLYCKHNVLSVGNQTKWESSRNIFPSLPLLHITFKPNCQIYRFDYTSSDCQPAKFY